MSESLKLGQSIATLRLDKPLSGVLLKGEILLLHTGTLRWAEVPQGLVDWKAEQRAREKNFPLGGSPSSPQGADVLSSDDLRHAGGYPE